MELIKAEVGALKARLDQIDSETVSEGAEKLRSLREVELLGMWRKGWAVLEAYPDLATRTAEGGRGAAAVVTYAEVERISGRNRESLAKWVKLALAHYDKDEFTQWALEEANRHVERWLAGMLPTPQTAKIAPPIPQGKYSVILADPPWRYDFAETDRRKIENHYPTMEVEEICALAVPFADNSVLYLWATVAKLIEAIQVLNSWGFRYVTNAVWDKEQIGMGYWFRGQHELLLVGVRGDFSPPDQGQRVSSVIRSKRAKHSEKPDAVYELIEAAYPNEQRLEMFARGARDGWVSWGNEVERVVA